jgi:hypothetical protein
MHGIVSRYGEQECIHEVNYSVLIIKIIIITFLHYNNNKMNVAFIFTKLGICKQSRKCQVFRNRKHVDAHVQGEKKVI